MSGEDQGKRGLFSLLVQDLNPLKLKLLIC